jgi:hypothetical protein
MRTSPSSVNARAMMRLTNGDCPHVAVKWFAITKSIGLSCSIDEIQSR